MTQLLKLPVLSRLEGECNRCGLCCFVSDTVHCLNLIIQGEPGKPEATYCGVWNKRFPGMAIALVDVRSGMVTGIGACLHGHPADDEAIIERGIGKGCSLRLR